MGINNLGVFTYKLQVSQEKRGKEMKESKLCNIRDTLNKKVVVQDLRDS